MIKFLTFLTILQVVRTKERSRPLLEILPTVIVACQTLVDYGNTITTECVPGAMHNAHRLIAVLDRMRLIVIHALKKDLPMEIAVPVKLVSTLP